MEKDGAWILYKLAKMYNINSEMWRNWVSLKKYHCTVDKYLTKWINERMNIICYYTISRRSATEILGGSTKSNSDLWSNRNGISKLWSKVAFCVSCSLLTWEVGVGTRHDKRAWPNKLMCSEHSMDINIGKKRLSGWTSSLHFESCIISRIGPWQLSSATFLIHYFYGTLSHSFV